ncbi:MAG: hypothetical protein O2794_00345 [bacterium]|nr:hypothetical protein [bacterium]
MNNEVHPNRILFYFIALSAILLLGVYWYSQMYVIEEENLLIDTVNSVAPPGSISDDTQNWETYRNEEFGFELVFGDDWGGYKIVEKRYDGGVVGFLFCLPTLQENYPDSGCVEEEIYSGYASVFYLVLTPRNDWVEPGDEPGASYLDENATYVAAIAGPHDIPDDLMVQYMDREKVIKTFKFIQ